jgi:hypothetical protein
MSELPIGDWRLAAWKSGFEKEADQNPIDQEWRVLTD